MVIEAAALFNGGPRPRTPPCTALPPSRRARAERRTRHWSHNPAPPRPARWLLGMSDARRANWAGESKSNLVRDTETPRCTAANEWKTPTARDNKKTPDCFNCGQPRVRVCVPGVQLTSPAAPRAAAARHCFGKALLAALLLSNKFNE